MQDAVLGRAGEERGQRGVVAGYEVRRLGGIPSVPGGAKVRHFNGSSRQGLKLKLAEFLARGSGAAQRRRRKPVLGQFEGGAADGEQALFALPLHGGN